MKKVMSKSSEKKQSWQFKDYIRKEESDNTRSNVFAKLHDLEMHAATR